MELKNIYDSVVFNDKTFTKRVLFSDRNLLTFVLNLKAGQTLPAHKHEKSTVSLLVLTGSADLRINAETKRVTTGSAAKAAGEDDFEIPAVAEDLSLLVNISPNPSNEIYSKELG